MYRREPKSQYRANGIGGEPCWDHFDQIGLSRHDRDHFIADRRYLIKNASIDNGLCLGYDMLNK
jgi:hypothetical protein